MDSVNAEGLQLQQHVSDRPPAHLRVRELGEVVMEDSRGVESEGREGIGKEGVGWEGREEGRRGGGEEGK